MPINLFFDDYIFHYMYLLITEAMLIFGYTEHFHLIMLLSKMADPLINGYKPVNGKLHDFWVLMKIYCFHCKKVFVFCGSNTWMTLSSTAFFLYIFQFISSLAK